MKELRAGDQMHADEIEVPAELVRRLLEQARSRLVIEQVLADR